MKIVYHRILILLLCLVSLNACKEDLDMDGLPPETQEGRNKIGCLINGEALVSQKRTFTYGSECLASYIMTDSGYYFYFVGSDLKNDPVRSVRLSQKMKLESGKTYSLFADTSRIKKVFCDYSEISIYNISTYEMDGNNPKGEIKIINLDEEKRIVAGTFWFDAVGITGHKIQIRKGRFDLKY